ncbi:MAG: sulfatase-like hydrolase/transferase [Verrucomicrobia bacterium]|nr:sulfatase-like hydrolase/transferase [Verrucomicrobiota bacterium]
MIKDRPTLVQKAIVALVVALLTFAKQIAFWLIDENRYYYLWQANDALALVLDVILLAVLALGASEILRALKADLPRKIFNHLFLIVFANGALTLFPARFLPHDDMTIRLQAGWVIIWLGVFSVTAYSFWKPRLQLVRRAANVCIVFSPLVPILFFQLLSTQPWSTPQESDPALRPTIPQSVQSAAGKHPIFVFVFDEWSYRRSFKDGALVPELVNLRRLREESFDFQRTWSFSSRTLHSLPAMVFQNDQRLDIGKRAAFFEMDGKKTAAKNFPSIFKSAKEAGYVTAMQGFYLPYATMLGNQVDYCRTFAVFPRIEGLPGRMVEKLITNLDKLTDPFTDHVRRVLIARLHSERWFNINRWLRDESFRLLDESPRNTFAFFHWPLPHGPFVLNEDGSYHGPYPKGELLAGLRGTAEDYHRHLIYMDRLIGEIVERLKASGKYDDAMIVVTGDHSWRSDPDEVVKNWKADLRYRKVPLFIKFPGQKSAHVIDKTVYNNLALKPLIDFVLRGKVDEQSAAEAIKQLENLPTPSGINSKRPKP